MSTLAPSQPVITEQQKQQFKDEGYMILERYITDEQLELLRNNCQGFIDESDATMKAKDVERLGLCARGKRYFISHCYQKKPELGRFIFSELMANLCRATIGDEAYLIWEQYVVKGIDKDSAFSWHQDAGYVHLDCPMYVTCWIPLDDITLDNGAVYLLPYSQLGIRTTVKHIMDPRTNDLVGYFGKEPGIPAIVPAGSIVAFSSYVFHRSGPNLTDKFRRVYLPQYCPIPLPNKPEAQAVRFLKSGEIVWQEGQS
jgi:ectoine hydroxylase-related dioxygenase (phytanoyl-CoA dioxygenase family)